jgi:hypothetical protein
MKAWRKTQGDVETGPEVIRPTDPSDKNKKPTAPYVFLD